jgi:hypothetical protein
MRSKITKAKVQLLINNSGWIKDRQWCSLRPALYHYVGISLFVPPTAPLQGHQVLFRSWLGLPNINLIGQPLLLIHSLSPGLLFPLICVEVLHM